MRALHFLLTYQCTRSCPHCFVWGAPGAHHSLSEDQVEYCLSTAPDAGIEQVCFEGGEPFLRFPTLLRCLEAASSRGLSPGAVTNGFWATDPERALSLLERLKQAGLSSLMVSSDDYHGNENEAEWARLAVEAAEALDIPVFTATTNLDQVMFRGRAAHCLAHLVESRDPGELTSCPHEDLADPERVHIDAWGYVHLCQGLTMGRVSDGSPLDDIVSRYNPDQHPIVAPLLEGGPHQLARAYGVKIEQGYADACHLCYRAREALRDQFPDYLAPGPMYGVKEERGG